MEKAKRQVSDRSERDPGNRRQRFPPAGKLATFLLALFAEHHIEENLSMDPVGWLDRSLADRDLELLSFLLQGLSYGRVEQIKISFGALLERLHTLGVAPNGAGLYEWLKVHDPNAAEVTRALKGWKHRLNVARDIQDVLTTLRSEIVIPEFSIAQYFNHASDLNFEERILKFCELFEFTSAGRARGKTWTGTGATWFAPTPAKGGTSKRLMMWLRWMLRDDGVDLGLWPRLLVSEPNTLSKADLFIPVDTHIFKFAQRWKLVKHKNPTWASVRSITEALRKVDPEDPIRFDFAICHAGKIAARAKGKSPTDSR